MIRFQDSLTIENESNPPRHEGGGTPVIGPAPSDPSGFRRRRQPSHGARPRQAVHGAAILPRLEKSRITQPQVGARAREVVGPLVLLLLLGLSVDTSWATRGVVNYPKTLTYSSEINRLTPQERDSIAWHDVVVLMGRPEHYRLLRTLRQQQAGNREIRFLYQVMPQIIPYWDGQPAAWVADTLWSPYRKMMYYARMNDWYLRDTAGARIDVGTDVMLNWTPHCPPGVYGDSKGMRVAEWYARTLAQMAVQGRGWGVPWRWDEVANGTPNGYIFEVYLDCWGSLRPMPNADPDRDGVAEGVTRNCTNGGYQEPLTLLIAQESAIFWSTIDELFPPDFVICLQSNNQYDGPPTRYRANGMKFENWLRPGYGRLRTWLDYFYGGLRPGGDGWDVGYAWTESNLVGGGPSVPERMRGWDLSFIETWQDGAPSEYERHKRFGLGTVLLGEGYFCHTRDQVKPQWEPEFDWDFGTPLEPFWRKNATPSDTVYVRRFDLGMVEVNPNATARLGIPPNDARFTFWMPVQDLTAEAAGSDSIALRWTIPDGEVNEADSYELRVASSTIDLDTWATATVCDGSPFTGPPGSVLHKTLGGLEPEHTYHFALRGTTRGYEEPVLSNAAEATTDVGHGGDETAPAQIEDIAAAQSGDSWIQLRWTAPGDDGDAGTARVYRFRYLPGERIEDEGDWARATIGTGLPLPHEAGTIEFYTLRGLTPSRSYGVAVRAEDDAGLLGPLSPAVLVETISAQPDTIPPAAISDLVGARGGAGEIRLDWTAPGDDTWNGRASSYEIRYLLDAVIASESDWSHSTSATNPPRPETGGSRQEWTLGGLAPGARYGIAVRARDEAGLLGGLSSALLAQSGANDDTTTVDEDLTPPAPVRSLTGVPVDHDTAELTWIAPGDDGNVGQADHYELRVLAGGRIDSEADWTRASTPAGVSLPVPLPAGSPQAVTVEGLAPETWYGALVRAVDAHGNRAAVSAGAFFVQPAAPPPPDAEPPERVTDLGIASADPSSVTLRWTAPSDAGRSSAASAYAMRRAEATVDDGAVWGEGLAIPDLPKPAAPGTQQSFRVGGLAPGRSYAFVLRSRDEAGNWSEDSNVLRAGTAVPPPPPRPPSAIEDLLAAAVDTQAVRLEWTAPGDDGAQGRAARYIARVRTGGAIESEQDWESARPVDDPGLPVPSVAGAREVWDFSGLAHRTTYGVSVRAVDDSGMVGGLSNPVAFTTDAPPPPPAPDPVVDLTSPEQGEDWIALTWTSPRCGEGAAPSASYTLAMRAGAVPIQDEPGWNASTRVETGLPPPSVPGATDSVRLASLESDAEYTVTLRARNREGVLGPLGNFLVVRTRRAADGIDTTEVEDTRPAPIEDLAAVAVADRSVRLAWTAVGEDSLSGRAASYDLRVLRGRPILDPQDWEVAARVDGLPPPAVAGARESFMLDGLAPATPYGVSLRARDASGKESALGNGLLVVTADSAGTAGDPAPPLPVGDLRAAAVAFDNVLAAWTVPAPVTGREWAIRFLVQVSTVPPSEETWGGGRTDSLTTGTRAPADTISLRIGGLSSGTRHYIAVRGRGASGRLASLSNVVAFTTPALDLSPPQPPASLRIAGRGSDGTVHLTWAASSDIDVAEYRVYGSHGAGSDWVLLTPDAVSAAAPDAEVPDGYALYAVSAIDVSGNEGPLSKPVVALESDVVLDGPFPHPVEDSCRFLLRVGSASAGERTVLRIIDVLGHEEAVLYEGTPGPGIREVRWNRTDSDGGRSAPGFYTVRLDIGTRRIERRIFLEP